MNCLKNLKCVWHEPKIHVLRLPYFGKILICESLVGLVSFETKVAKTAEIELEIELIYCLPG